MEWLAVFGALVLTLLPLAVTGWFIALLFQQWAWGGFHVLKPRDWVSIFGLAVVQVGMWIFWWIFIGSHLHFSIGVS